jgi:class 3 adenylate cyclase
VVDAVRRVVEIQAAMAKHNAGVPEQRRIAFRVGVNIGDIIVDRRDIFGDGVNVAARFRSSGRQALRLCRRHWNRPLSQFKKPPGAVAPVSVMPDAPLAIALSIADELVI